MQKLMFQIGSSFLRAFLAAIVVLAPGVLAAPNLNRMYLLGVAALASSIAAGLRAVQAYATVLSVARYLGAPFGALADAFLRAFLSSMIVLSTGWLNAPDLHAGRAAAVGIVVGAVAAGIRAVQGLLSKGEWPAPHVGVAPPPP